MKKYTIIIIISAIITNLISIFFFEGATIPTIVTFFIFMFILGGFRSMKGVNREKVARMNVINSICCSIGACILVFTILLDWNSFFLLLGLLIFVPTFIGKIIYYLTEYIKSNRG